MFTNKETLTDALIEYREDKSNIQNQKKLLEILEFPISKNLTITEKDDLIENLIDGKYPSLDNKSILYQCLEEKCENFSPKDYEPLRIYLNAYFHGCINKNKFFISSLSKEERVKLTLLKLNFDIENKEKSLQSKLDDLFENLVHSLVTPTENNLLKFHHYIKSIIFNENHSLAQNTIKQFNKYFESKSSSTQEAEEKKILQAALFIKFKENIMNALAKDPSLIHEKLKKKIKKEASNNPNSRSPLKITSIKIHSCEDELPLNSSENQNSLHLIPLNTLLFQKTRKKSWSSLNKIEDFHIIDKDDNPFNLYEHMKDSSRGELSKFLDIRINKNLTSEEKDSLLATILNMVRENAIDYKLNECDIAHKEKFYNLIRCCLGKNRGDIVEAYGLDFNKLLKILGIEYQYMKIYSEKKITHKSLKKITDTFTELLTAMKIYLVEKNIFCNDFLTFTHIIFPDDYSQVYNSTLKFFQCLEKIHGDTCLNIINSYIFNVKDKEVSKPLNPPDNTSKVSSYMSQMLLFKPSSDKFNTELTPSPLEPDNHHPGIIQFLRGSDPQQKSSHNPIYQTPDLPNFSSAPNNNFIESNSEQQLWFQSNLYSPKIQAEIPIKFDSVKSNIFNGKGKF